MESGESEHRAVRLMCLGTLVYNWAAALLSLTWSIDPADINELNFGDDEWMNGGTCDGSGKRVGAKSVLQRVACLVGGRFGPC